MKRVLFVLSTLLAALSQPAGAQQASVPTLPFESVPNPLKLPHDIHFGEIAGVAVNSKGHVFVFSRGNSTGPSYMATAAQLLEFDANGKFVREIGKNLYAWSYAHAVRIDKQDNIWVVDKGSDMILKINPQGRVEWVFGRKGEASHYQVPPDTAVDPLRPADARRRGRHAARRTTTLATRCRSIATAYFNQPTDVAWDSQGNTYSRDGYINSRVGKAATRGRVARALGIARQRAGQFDTPHGIAVGPNDEMFVADRGNRRIQVFDPAASSSGSSRSTCRCRRRQGRRLATRRNNCKTGSLAPGAPDALCMTPGPNPVLFVGDLYPSRIYKVSLDGKVLGVYGSGAGTSASSAGSTRSPARPRTRSGSASCSTGAFRSWWFARVHGRPRGDAHVGPGPESRVGPGLKTRLPQSAEFRVGIFGCM